MIDINNNIIDSGFSSNLFKGLKDLNANKIIVSDENGLVKTSDISYEILSNINYISKINNQILISENNKYNAITINKNNLSNLNTINTDVLNLSNNVNKNIQELNKELIKFNLLIKSID